MAYKKDKEIKVIKRNVLDVTAKNANPAESENRGVAFVIFALSFTTVGIGAVVFGNVPVAVGLLVGSIVALFGSLFHLTKENRERKGK
ncbi:MAG: hypothetical protein NWF00_10425 [Candidatus Bathyarchaeota archaeon]|nr:hypothetical protein [Candidatus Bathyarchaeota archaeon]